MTGFLHDPAGKYRVLTLLVAELGLVALAASRGEAADDLDAVWEVRNTPDTLYVRVASNGCTEPGSFRVEREVGRGEAVGPTIRIVRLKPDACKMRVPEGVLIGFDKASVGLAPFAPFVLANPFGTTPSMRALEQGQNRPDGRTK